ncbi:MAG: DNA polymerase I [Pseudomonadota bacterium]|nr:DNA polymerase I [Pseudomonadota bacterium]
MSKQLILVDGSSYLYRAYHALPPLSNSQGMATGAIKGVMNMLNRLQKDYTFDYFAVVFDAKGKTFRDELFEQYKSHRPPMPDDLREQIKPLHDLIDALGLPKLVVEGVEADDVIGTLARQGAEVGMNVVISTGDKDMAQLVNERITLVNTMTNKVYDRDGVIEKFTVPPELIIDYLALVGDKSDNIPGLAGVGEKTASALLNQVGSIDTIYQQLEKLPELSIRGAKSLPKKFEEHEDRVRLSHLLATIKLDCELELSIEQLTLGEPDTQALFSLYQQLEFKTQLRELEAIEGESSAGAAVALEPVETHYETITTQAQLEPWLEKLARAEAFAVDTETTSLNYMDAQLVGISFSVSAHEACYIPLGHELIEAPEQLDLKETLVKLKPFLEDPSRTKIGQHLKYDMHILRHYGINICGDIRDTMLESYVLNPTATRHDMDSLADYYLQKNTTKFTDIAGKGAKQLRFDQISLEKAAPYACEDADITWQLHGELSLRLADLPKIQKVYDELEAPLMPILMEIEHLGVKLDVQKLQTHSQELQEKLSKIEQTAYELAGETFNLNSPKQLGEILFEKLELPIVKKTAKGAPSTAEAVLQELAEDYELPKAILDYRGLAKLKSTYTDKLPLVINQRTGRVHTSYHQAVTATGRLSSSDPNLQNIPIRNDEGRRIRQAFIAEPGYKIVAADYSQVELRIMAHLSGDETLLKAFNSNADIHLATAAEILEKPMSEVSSEERRRAKAVNFGLIYGMSAFGLAKQLGVDRQEAQSYIDKYFARYPGVADFMERIKASAKETGYVETVFGRRLYLPDINAKNGMIRQAAERTAINAPMQGTAADIIKRAMIDLQPKLAEISGELAPRMIMQVHDELVFEVPEAKLDEVNELIKATMENAASLDVPLIVEVGVGDNWDDAH